MNGSILDTTKKILGLDATYSAFDPDVIMHINTAFFALNQLGIGPADGFMIEDSTTLWDEYLGRDINLNAVKTYIYLRVRILFDPPTTSYLINALQEQIKEIEWRLNVNREEVAWTEPITTPVDLDTLA